VVSQISQRQEIIEAQASFDFGHAQIVRRLWDRPIDVLAMRNEHYLEYAMLPRSQQERGCFPVDERNTGMPPVDRIGEIFFFPAGHLVHAVSHCRYQHSIVCRFQPEAAAGWLDQDVKWTRARLQASLDVTHPGIRSLLAQIGQELLQPGFGGDVLVELMTAQVGIQLARYLMGVGEPACSGGLSAKDLRRIEERLAEDGAPPSLTELAALCGLSVRHLTRGFRKSRQRSLGAYITERRAQRARQLLKTGVSVKSVAYTMGFSSPAAFSTAFRRATGERPREYARRDP
jgi:AraC family transcriptional regulator